MQTRNSSPNFESKILKTIKIKGFNSKSRRKLRIFKWSGLKKKVDEILNVINLFYKNDEK